MKFAILLSLLPLLVTAAPTEPQAAQIGPAISYPFQPDTTALEFSHTQVHSYEKRLYKETYYVDLYNKDYMWVMIQDDKNGTTAVTTRWEHRAMLTSGGPSYSSAAPKSSASAAANKSSSANSASKSASGSVGTTRPSAASSAPSVSKSGSVSSSKPVSASASSPKPASSSAPKASSSAPKSSPSASASKPASSSAPKSSASASASKAASSSAPRSSASASTPKAASSSAPKPSASSSSPKPADSSAPKSSASSSSPKPASSSAPKSSASTAKPASSSAPKPSLSSSVSKPASSSAPKPSLSSSVSKPASSSAPKPSSSSSSAAAPATSGSASIGVSAADQAKFLTLHNDFRAKYSAGPLVWDDTLANFALKTAQSCKYGHTGGPYGENIAAGVGGGYNIDKAFSSWANEDALYDFAKPGYASATGHFTQIVWKNTGRLGCAAASCADGSIFTGYRANSTYVVCEYQAPGNVVSSNAARTAEIFTANVGPKVL